MIELGRRGEIAVLTMAHGKANALEIEPLEAITAEHFHKQFDLNVRGLILATQEAARHFGPEGGSVINISSVVSTLGVPNAFLVAVVLTAAAWWDLKSYSTGRHLFAIGSNRDTALFAGVRVARREFTVYVVTLPTSIVCS